MRQWSCFVPICATSPSVTRGSERACRSSGVGTDYLLVWLTRYRASRSRRRRGIVCTCGSRSTIPRAEAGRRLGGFRLRRLDAGERTRRRATQACPPARTEFAALAEGHLRGSTPLRACDSDLATRSVAPRGRRSQGLRNDPRHDRKCRRALAVATRPRRPSPGPQPAASGAATGDLSHWNTIQDVKTHDVGLGNHIADLSTKALPAGNQVKYTFHWPEADRWEGADFVVHTGSTAPTAPCSAQRSKSHAR
jgi:hypothetical protein